MTPAKTPSGAWLTPSSGLAGFASRLRGIRTGLIPVIATSMVFLVLLSISWAIVVGTGQAGLLVDEVSAKGPVGGVRIAAVQPRGPAYLAGVRPGDWIVAVDGRPAAGALEGGKMRLGEPVRLLLQPNDRAGESGLQAVVLTPKPVLASRGNLTDVIAMTIVAGLYLGVGNLVMLARTRDPAARILFFGAASLAVSQAAALSTYGDAPAWLAKLEPWGFRLTVSAALHLFLAFPAPQPVLQRLRAFGGLELSRFGGATAILYVIPFGAGLIVDSGPAALQAGWPLFLAGWLCLALAALAHNYRIITAPVRRAQLRWVLWSMAMGVLGFVLWAVAGVLPRSLLLAATAAFPIAVAFAILRYRLFEIDVLIRRTLVYGTLTATLAAMFYGAILILQSLMPERSPAMTVLVTLGITMTVQPIRRTLQAGIDRRFYRARYDAERTLAAFSQLARDTVELETLCSALLLSVGDALQPSRISLWLSEPAKHASP